MKWRRYFYDPWDSLSADQQWRMTIAIMAISSAAIIVILFLWAVGGFNLSLA